MSNTEIWNGEVFQVPIPGVCVCVGRREGEGILYAYATISILIRNTELKFLSSQESFTTLLNKDYLIASSYSIS